MSVTAKDNSSQTQADVNLKIHNWFESHIQTLRIHELTLTTGTASTETQNVFKALMSEDETSLSSLARAQSSIYFLKNIIQDYINELTENKCYPTKLALDVSDAKVLVWAEVGEYDDNNHDQLLLAEASVNAKYYQYGFHVSSTIVEKGDKLSIPSHYQAINISK